MGDARRATGRRGEELAAAFFVARGYEIVERNWRCEIGEADLIIRKKDELRFVEVKTRKSIAGGLPEESVTEAKVETLADLSDRYCEDHAEHSAAIHLDVLSLCLGDWTEYTYLSDIDAS